MGYWYRLDDRYGSNRQQQAELVPQRVQQPEQRSQQVQPSQQVVSAERSQQQELRYALIKIIYIYIKFVI